MTSLKGSPYCVGGDFKCDSNKLINLIGSPEEVDGSFECSNNNLNSLEGMPLEIGRYFACDQNRNLLELDSVSYIGGDILCDRHIDITKFKGYCKNIDNS